MQVTLGKIIEASKSNDVIGISERATIIDYIDRALEIAAYKANWDSWMGTLDICSDPCGYVTLPYFVDSIAAVNVGGCPTIFRNSWYEFHINGVGSNRSCGCGCGYFWDDMLLTPVFQDLRAWSCIAAICEDAIDGNGSLELIVQGETMDANSNAKEALTIPASGPSLPGVRVPLLLGYASTDQAVTQFRKIFQVTKPATRGYVKLIAFPPQQMASAVTIGYYGPNETNPIYKRIKVNASCKWVRVRYRRKPLALLNDYDIVPINSYQAMIWLLKSIRLSDTNNTNVAQVYEDKAVTLMNEHQSLTDGSWGPIQFESFGSATIDFR